MLVAVPCSDDDCLVLLDSETGDERGRVAVGSHPVHLATVGDRVFVATMGDRAVSVVVDGAVRRIETGVLGPSHFATTADGDVLVPCTGGDALAVIDADELELRARVGVGGEPHDVAVRDGLAFVGSRADGTVSVVDLAAYAVEATHDAGAGARIQGVEAAEEGVYAVDQAGARLLRLTAEGVEREAPVGANPYDAAVDDDRVLVAGRDDGTVTAVSRAPAGRPNAGGGPDPSDRRVYEVGGTPSDVVLSGADAWVLDRDRPSLLALGSQSSGDRRTVDVPHPTFAAAVDPTDDSRVYASHYDDAAVSAIDLDEGRALWTTETPAHPFEPAVI